MNQFQFYYFPLLIKISTSCFRPRDILASLKKGGQCMKTNIFVLVQIVLLSKYWSDAAKPRGWIHSIWGGGRREELPQATVTYKTMMSKIGMYWYFQLGCWYKKEEFWAKSFEPIKFSLPLAGLLIRPTAEADEGCRGQSSSSGRSADIICSVRDKASQWSWWEGCARPERLVVSS